MDSCNRTFKCSYSFEVLQCLLLCYSVFQLMIRLSEPNNTRWFSLYYILRLYIEVYKKISNLDNLMAILPRFVILKNAQILMDKCTFAETSSSSQGLQNWNINTTYQHQYVVQIIPDFPISKLLFTLPLLHLKYYYVLDSLCMNTHIHYPSMWS